MSSLRLATLLSTAALTHGACMMKYTNKATAPVTICMRFNGDAPGSHGNKTLHPGDSWEVPCRASIPGQSWESYLSLSDWTRCGWDQGCSPNYGSCQHYPWAIGQGVGTNGLWYGSIGTNWDGAGKGYTSGYDKVQYGLHFQCTSYNRTQFPNLNCTVDGAKPTCTPNKPNYNQPNSGVVECDPDQTLMLDLVPLGAPPSPAPTPSGACSVGFCSKASHNCVVPTKVSCLTNATACAAVPDTTCENLTKLCVKTANERCVPSAQCAAGYICDATVMKCAQPQPNEPCMGDGDCFSADGNNYCNTEIGLCMAPTIPCTF